MFDNTAQDDGELFATGAEDDASDAGTSQEVDLDLDAEESRNEAKPQDAQTVRQKTVESFQRRIDAGEMTIQDLPASQKWVAKFLKAPKARETMPETDIDRLLDEKLAKRENDRQFGELKSKLESAALRKEQKAAIQSEYGELKAMGVPTAKALQKAIALAGVSLDQDSSRKAAMRVPLPGNMQAKEASDGLPYEFDGDEYKGPKGTPEERIAAMKKELDSSGQTGGKVWDRQ